MNVSAKRTPRLRFCALVALSLGFLSAASAAQAIASSRVIAWCSPAADAGQCAVPAAASSGVSAIAAGNFHSLALKDDGRVIAWGCAPWADAGQCAVPAAASSGVTAIAAGAEQSLALKQDGSVIAWGCANGGFGQCSVPAAASSGVIAISAGWYNSLALKQDGSVIAWGCDNGGPSEPCAVPAAASNGVTAIDAGQDHSLALKQDGSVIAWGCAPGTDSGQCTVPAPASNGVTAIAAGASHSLALKQDGSVIAWGCINFDVGQCTVPAAATSGVTAIAATFSYSLALKQDGSVISWGCVNFDFGQCNVPPAATSGVTAISAADWHGLALRSTPNRSPDCSAVTAAPRRLAQMRDQMVAVTLFGATDPDGDPLSYRIDGVSQDEYVTGVGDDTSPDAALTEAGADWNQVFLRSEANPQLNGRVYRIAYTVSDGQGGSCSGTAGPSGTTTAKVSVPRKKDTPALDDGDVSSWNSFTGAPVL
jgi:alpha-tubulin suppressor-like RCC1 family protein